MEEDGCDVQGKRRDRVAGLEVSCKLDDELGVFTGQMSLEFEGESKLSIGVLIELCLFDVVVYHVLSNISKMIEPINEREDHQTSIMIFLS